MIQHKGKEIRFVKIGPGNDEEVYYDGKLIGIADRIEGLARFTPAEKSNKPLYVGLTTTIAVGKYILENY